MIKDDKIYIVFILECVDDLRLHLNGSDKNLFLNNRTVQKATLRTLHELTETTQRLSTELKNILNDIDWVSISGFRNVLVHDYLGDLKYETVWEIIEKEIPKLSNALKKYYDSKF